MTLFGLVGRYERFVKFLAFIFRTENKFEDVRIFSSEILLANNQITQCQEPVD
jgi:hypothetical protein